MKTGNHYANDMCLLLEEHSYVLNTPLLNNIEGFVRYDNNMHLKWLGSNKKVIMNKLLIRTKNWYCITTKFKEWRRKATARV